MPIYAQFECIIKELNKKHKCIFKENIVLFLGKFWHDGSECHHRIKKHKDSKNIKSKFHCICNAISSHCWYLLQVYSSHKPNWCMFFLKHLHYCTIQSHTTIRHENSITYSCSLRFSEYHTTFRWNIYCVIRNYFKCNIFKMLSPAKLGSN